MIKEYTVIPTEKFMIKVEDIYEYIAYELHNPFSAKKYYDDIRKIASSLKHFPNRGTILYSDSYMGSDYRKIFAHNYTIIYYVEGDTVYIVDVLYGKSNIKSKLEIEFGEWEYGSAWKKWYSKGSG